jgi:hypothetical protein
MGGRLRIIVRAPADGIRARVLGIRAARTRRSATHPVASHRDDGFEI